MTNPTSISFVSELLGDLRNFLAWGNEALALAAREHQALAGAGEYEPFDFHRSRKELLSRLNSLIVNIKHWRQLWQQTSPADRAGCADVKLMIQTLQDLLVRILQLDRENQQALLRRGLVPACQVTACAAPPSHFVANLYLRHNPR